MVTVLYGTSPLSRVQKQATVIKFKGNKMV